MQQCYLCTLVSNMIIAVQAPGSQGAGQDLDIRGTMYSLVVASGQQDDYDAMKQLYLAVSVPTEIDSTCQT